MSTPNPDPTPEQISRLLDAVMQPQGGEAPDAPWSAQPDGLGQDEWEVVYTPTAGPCAGETVTVASYLSSQEYAEYVASLHNAALDASDPTPEQGPGLTDSEANADAHAAGYAAGAAADSREVTPLFADDPEPPVGSIVLLTRTAPTTATTSPAREPWRD